jgi:putative flippase GtrA
MTTFSRPSVTPSKPRTEHGAAGRRDTKAAAALGEIAQQFSKFTLVGVVGTVIHYGVLGLLAGILYVHPVPASAAGFITSAVISYLLNYRITFSSSMDHRKALPRFLAVGTIGLGLNSLLVGWLPELLRIHWFFAQVVATLVVLCWNFAINRFWTFSVDCRQA